MIVYIFFHVKRSIKPVYKTILSIIIVLYVYMRRKIKIKKTIVKEDSQYKTSIIIYVPCDSSLDQKYYHVQ